jgi:signal transduction histidine kinase
VRTGGFGLLEMRDRVELGGGPMETETAPSEGTMVRANADRAPPDRR